jgi:hypothetical protein
MRFYASYNLHAGECAATRVRWECLGSGWSVVLWIAARVVFVCGVMTCNYLMADVSGIVPDADVAGQFTHPLSTLARVKCQHTTRSSFIHPSILLLLPAAACRMRRGLQPSRILQQSLCTRWPSSSSCVTTNSGPTLRASKRHTGQVRCWSMCGQVGVGR